ncbi:MAG: uroporphyrinogen decarboxylase family protein, partial [Candidatus Ranarchaeia archaeon]
MSQNIPSLKDEALTPLERVQTVIELKEPDRVPVFPIIDTIPCKIGGITTKDWLFNPQKAHHALKKAFEYFGGWDHLEFVGGVGGAVPNPYPTIGSPVFQRSLMPGFGLDENSQAIIAHEEEPVFDKNGYEQLIEHGFFRYADFRRAGYLGLFRGSDPDVQSKSIQEAREIYDYWMNEQKISFVGPLVSQPFEVIVHMRTLTKFMLDLMRYRDKIRALLDQVIDGFIEAALRVAHPKIFNLPKPYWILEILCLSGGGGAQRGGRRLYSPKLFEELYWPYLKRMINRFYRAGYRSALHLDTNWDDVLPLIKEVPKGQIAWIETDGTTDLPKAKKLLGDHYAIVGDVPATLLSLGTPKQVEKYCKELIDQCAEGGGFMLATGCNAPPDSKFEN